MRKVYLVCDGYGNYLTDMDNTSCDWSVLADNAKSFTTYNKAYNLMARVNKCYGYKKCVVVSVTDDEFNSYTFEKIINNAK